ncbi:MAG: RelA/SpoT family protein [Alphaproteobacteria bacterium]|jgi:guanosine-3',5'-bis(diphosphate) 3'-pyrophosphohydrolase
MFQSSYFSESFSDFKSALQSYDKNFNEKLFVKAIEVAESSHKDQFRASGDPYIIHPYEVCKSLIDLKLDTETVITGLLHDVIEDTEYSKEQLNEIFGKSIASLVDGLTKIDFLEEKKITRSEKEAENFRKLLISTAKDIRVLIIKLADRLHNIKTIHFFKDVEKRKRVSNETLLIYAPLAERLGFENWKSVLENISFKNLHPDIYNRINDKIDNTFKNLESSFRDLENIINNFIHKENINVKIHYRKKAPYSIWKKINKRNSDLNSISDIAAVRIITKSTRDCYKVLGIIHRNFSAKVGRTKDYISNPKPNGYRSIHTDIIFNNKVFEIQIRSRAMHMIAENGIAAHWRYKYLNKNENDQNMYAWLRDAVNYVEEKNEQHLILNKTSQQFFDEQIYVFSPKGDLYTLPVDSTPVDFAYTIHTDIGDRCSGAIVNGQEVPLKTKLSSGDQVEIILNEKNTISPLWIRFVKKEKVREKIRHFFRSKRRKEFEKLGKDILKYLAKLKNIDETESFYSEILSQSEFKYKNKLFENIGRGFLSRKDLNDLFRDLEKSFVKKLFTKEPNPRINVSRFENGIAVNYATCCSPISGDNIISVMSYGRGLVVHSTMCESLSYYHKDNFYRSNWGNSNLNKDFSTRIEIIIKNQPGSLFSITSIFDKHHINIENIRIAERSKKNYTFLIDIKIEDSEKLKFLLSEMKTLSQVDKVKRQSLTY